MQNLYFFIFIHPIISCVMSVCDLLQSCLLLKKKRRKIQAVQCPIQNRHFSKVQSLMKPQVRVRAHRWSHMLENVRNQRANRKSSSCCHQSSAFTSLLPLHRWLCSYHQLVSGLVFVAWTRCGTCRHSEQSLRHRDTSSLWSPAQHSTADTLTLVSLSFQMSSSHNQSSHQVVVALVLAMHHHQESSLDSMCRSNLQSASREDHAVMVSHCVLLECTMATQITTLYII